MKKILFALLVIISAFGSSSCKHDPDLPFPATTDYPQIVTNVSAANSFKLAEIQGTGNATASFGIEVKGGNANNIEAIEVYRTFIGFNIPVPRTPPTAPTLAIGGPTVLLRTVPPTSGIVEVNIDELIPGLTRVNGPSHQDSPRTPLTRASLRVGEGFHFTYALLLKDGTRITFNPSFLNAPFAGSVFIQ
jgi:hypothetical protein